MNRKEITLVSFTVASIVTIIDIGWRIFGGLVSGGRYSHPHDWNELIHFTPEFIFFLVSSLSESIFALSLQTSETFKVKASRVQP